MHAFTSIASSFAFSLDKFYAVLLFVSLLLDCMNVQIRCRSRSASGGGREGAACHGRPIRCPIRALSGHYRPLEAPGGNLEAPNRGQPAFNVH